MPGNLDNLVRFLNRTKSGTALFETALSGDPLYSGLMHHKARFYTIHFKLNTPVGAVALMDFVRLISEIQSALD